MIIGLVGYARSGKDTTAGFILKSETLVGTKQKYAFADPLKDTVDYLFEWDERHRDGELKEVEDPFWGISPRHAYQTFGTEWARKCIREDFWLKMAEKKLKNTDHTIITDVRFVNEAKWVKRNGGLLIKIIRPDAPPVASHSSEKEIPLIRQDYTVYNTGPMGFLEASINYTLEDIVKST